MDFTYYTDEPVRLATDLVNTLSATSGEDELGDPAALARFLAGHGRPVTEPPTEADLDEVRAHRALLREVFSAADEREAAEKLNRLLVSSHAVPRIAGHGHERERRGREAQAGRDGDRHGMHLHFESNEAGIADWVGAVCGMALAVVLCDYGKARFGICDAGSCGDAYIDMSKNCSKRYCSEGCAHRASVAAFRARKRQGAVRPPGKASAGTAS